MERDFAPDGAMLLAGLVLLPVLGWLLHKRPTLRTTLFGGVMLLLFSRGTLELVGIGPDLTRLLAEGIALACLLFLVLPLGAGRVKLPGISLVIAFSAVSVVSTVVNGVSGVLLVLFFRDYLAALVFMYAVLNSPLSNHERNLLFKLTGFLLISQIAANGIKALVIGDVIEPYIGTMAVLGGSLSIIFALVGSVVAVSFYLTTGRTRYLLLLLGFVVFSMIGGKRATIFYVPLVYVALLVAHRVFSGDRLGLILKGAFSWALLSLVVIYASVRLMPSLNPEQVVWGSFDIEYATEYSTRYLTTGAGAVEEIGRADAPAYLLTQAASESMSTLLFGYGSGHLIKTRFNEEAAGAGQSDVSLALHGVGYGARTAFLQLFLQVGLVGAALYLGVWLRLFHAFSRKVRTNGDPLRVMQGRLVVFGLLIVFLLDFFTYSVVFVQFGPVVAVAFLGLRLLADRPARPSASAHGYTYAARQPHS